MLCCLVEADEMEQDGGRKIDFSNKLNIYNSAQIKER